jgi:hypothetical protein
MIGIYVRLLRREPATADEVAKRLHWSRELRCDIATFGYNRDGKRGHEQMVIALLCSAEGCPVGAEVFAGNTQDGSTVLEKIAQLQRLYGLKEIIFVGDRGMFSCRHHRVAITPRPIRAGSIGSSFLCPLTVNGCLVGPIDQSKYLATTKGYAGTVKINGLLRAPLS